MPPRMTPNASDHDLLIRIDTKVDGLNTSLNDTRSALDARINETRTALSSRINEVAKEKANLADLDPLRSFIQDVQVSGKEKDKEQDARLEKQDEKVSAISRNLWIGVGIILAANVTVVPLIVGVALYWLTHAK